LFCSPRFGARSPDFPGVVCSSIPRSWFQFGSCMSTEFFPRRGGQAQGFSCARGHRGPAPILQLAPCASLIHLCTRCAPLGERSIFLSVSSSGPRLFLVWWPRHLLFCSCCDSCSCRCLSPSCSLVTGLKAEAFWVLTILLWWVLCHKHQVFGEICVRL
jgi:hypothetical protein